jgi:hypothetical protein
MDSEGEEPISKTKIDPSGIALAEIENILGD